MRQSLILIFTLLLLQSCSVTPFKDNINFIENNYYDSYAQVYPQEIKASREVANEVIKIVSRNNPEVVLQIGAQKVIISTGYVGAKS